jgi:hypothetical protein
MPTLTIEYATEAERLQYERMVAYIQEMNHLGRSAAYGTVMETCELYALERGRTLIRDQLAATVQSRAEAEKKRPVRGRRAASRGM